jgi:hypothetical protein
LGASDLGITGLLAVCLTITAGRVAGQGTESPPRGAPSSQSSTQAFARDTDTPATGFVAGVRLDYSRSEPGNLTDVTPSAGYQFPSWRLAVGLPVVFSSPAAHATNAASSVRGVGDASGSVSYALGGPAAFWKSSLTGTAPTGDRTLGLGSGRATWNWSNYVDHDFDRITPFVDLGVGNGLSSSAFGEPFLGRSSSRRASLGAGRLARPYSIVGKLAVLDAGAEIDASKTVSLSVSAYDILPWGPQTAISRFALPQQPLAAGAAGPVSKSRKGQRFFDVSTLTAGSSALTRDHGVEVAVTASPTSKVDLTASYSRSIPLQLDTVGVSLSLRWRSASR